MTMPDEPKFLAAIDLLRRTGAREVQIRYSDDEKPIVWFLVIEYVVDDRGVPTGGQGEQRRETASGFTPTKAAVRLCERLVDGGICAHCHRGTLFLEDVEPIFGESASTREATRLIEAAACLVQWDPELATFRRSCEGDT